MMWSVGMHRSLRVPFFSGPVSLLIRPTRTPTCLLLSLIQVIDSFTLVMPLSSECRLEVSA